MNGRTVTKSVDYWKQDFLDPDAGASHSFGTELRIEVPYRHYWELRTFQSLIGLSGRVRMLELGSGTGRWAFALAPYLASYVGVDLNGSMVAKASARAKLEKRDNIVFVCEDIADYLKHCAETFDVIYIAGVSLYFTDDNLAAFLRQVSSRLAENGVIIERTTTSPESHAIDRADYAAFYRSDRDIESLFSGSLDGFELTASRRSYPFLRGRLFYRIPDYLYRRYALFGKFFKSVPAMRLMRFFSGCAEAISPSLSVEGDHSYDHKFFVFKRSVMK